MQPQQISPYLAAMADQFPTKQSLYTEIINLRAILNLPKGTEHFMSDLHGEYEAFCHILNNCSGVIREKAETCFGDELSRSEMNDFLTLIYYPAEKLALLQEYGSLTEGWYRTALGRLIRLSRTVSSRYTRSKVRKAMPPEYAYVLDELLHAQPDEDNNQLVYHDKIIESLIRLGSGNEFIIALCGLIKRLAVDRLHIVGDIFDRGPHADRILDLLTTHHAVDVEWGNHDVLWMGAACGNPVSCAAAVRNCLSYDNLDILESGYGISLRKLMLFAQNAYPSLPLDQAAIHAITVIMFKLEGQLIESHPEYKMEERRLLHHVDWDRHVLCLNGQEYSLRAMPFPTIDPHDPYGLTPEEQDVSGTLTHAFRHSERLQRHVDFLYQKGRMYRIVNGNLLFHGCIPMTETGNLATVELAGVAYSGRELMEHHDSVARSAFYQRLPSAVDFMWYLWCSAQSPVCGRQIRTFERAFVTDESTWEEPMDPYYKHCETPEGCDRVLREFGLFSEENHIINGHTPIRVREGESPIKADGRLIVIDGGFCRSLQKRTGIAGYTLISNSHGLRISAHQPFTSIAAALNDNDDIHSDSQVFFQYRKRVMVGDTDRGAEIKSRIEILETLLDGYRKGWVRSDR